VILAHQKVTCRFLGLDCKGYLGVLLMSAHQVALLGAVDRIVVGFNIIDAMFIPLKSFEVVVHDRNLTPMILLMLVQLFLVLRE
jgi:hypothetical protein